MIPPSPAFGPGNFLSCLKLYQLLEGILEKYTLSEKEIIDRMEVICFLLFGYRPN